MPSPLRARAFRTLAAVLLLVALLVPGSAPALAADGEPLQLKAGTDQDLQVLNPWQSVVVADFEVFTLNYDTLVGFGQNIEPVAGFAESWEQSEDGLTWTFHIRPDMLWSDGEPATAEDARWTYQLILDAAETETGYLGQGYLDGYLTNAGVTSVEAPDPETLVVTTEFPNTLLLQAYVPILPKHIWSEYSLEQIGDTTVDGYFANEPTVVGTGPYQAVEWEPGGFIRFQRNENYWGEQGAADEVIIQHFASPDTMVQALRTRRDRLRPRRPGRPVRRAGRASRTSSPSRASRTATPSSRSTPGATSEGYGGSTSALSDVAFRDALGYAIDKDALVEAVLAGHGEPGSTIIPPFHTRWHVDPDNPRTFDIEEAKTPTPGRRLRAQRRQPAARQGGQPDHAAPHVARFGIRERLHRPVPGRVVRPAGHPGGRRRHRGRQADRGRDRPERRYAGRQLRHLHVGLGRRPRSDLAAQLLPNGRDRRVERQLLLEPAATTSGSSTSAPSRIPSSARAVSSTTCSSSSTTRPRTTSSTTTRSCTPTGPTSSAAG